jgi:hypothetical protein
VSACKIKRMRFSPHWTFGIMLMALTAHAESPAPRGSTCTGPQLKLDPYLKARKPWVAAVHAVSKRLSEYGEVDRCAVIDVQWMGSEAIVRASVPDGRSAIRHVGNPETLTSTVIALLALPNAPLALAAADTRSTQDTSSASRSSGQSGTANTSRTSTSTQRSADARGARDHDEVANADIPIPSMDLHELGSDNGDESGPGGRRSQSSRRGHTEVGAFTSAARLTGSDVLLAGIGAGALVQYETNGWLLGASGRAEKLYNLNDDRTGRIQSESVALIGPTFGRRVTQGKVWVDAVVPLEITFESSKVQPTSGPQTVPGTSRTDLRIGAMVRASWRLAGSYRFFGAVDGDVSPARLFDPPQETEASQTIVERRPPRFSVGLSVGVLWGAL